MRDMPDIGGHVTRVSADAFADDRTGLRYYRVELLLDDTGTPPSARAPIP
jgi:hypothetical protein